MSFRNASRFAGFGVMCAALFRDLLQTASYPWRHY